MFNKKNSSTSGSYERMGSSSRRRQELETKTKTKQKKIERLEVINIQVVIALGGLRRALGKEERLLIGSEE
jgi:hypothetical protein